MANPGKSQPVERDRQRKALELRMEGRSWSDIAEIVGWADHSGAIRAVDALLDRVEAEAAAEYRAVELARLDALHRAWWDAALARDEKAAGIILRTHQARSKLLGLAAPQQVQVQSIGVSQEAFTTTVGDDMRAIGFPVTGTHTPVWDTPLEPDDPDEPWANT